MPLSLITSTRKALGRTRRKLRELRGSHVYPPPSTALRNLGVTNFLRYVIQQLRIAHIKDRRLVTLRSKHAKFPLYCRANTSDPWVFSQIFLHREYECVEKIAAKEMSGLIIDCGANVGYSSSYFLSHFPNASLIAVEPDPENVKLLRLNLAPFGDRARIVVAGVWSHVTSLTMRDVPYRGGAEWARVVREAQPGESGAFAATDITELLALSGKQRISLLKLDIEGSEAIVFEHGFESWLEKVDNILIELHDDSPFGDARSVFNSAIHQRGFHVRTVNSGDPLTICSRGNPAK